VPVVAGEVVAARWIEPEAALAEPSIKPGTALDSEVLARRWIGVGPVVAERWMGPGAWTSATAEPGAVTIKPEAPAVERWMGVAPVGEPPTPPDAEAERWIEPGMAAADEVAEPAADPAEETER
jgi:hypothetical protein